MDADLDHKLGELMARAQDGDRAAYEALLLEVAVLVRGFVRRRLREPDGIEDIVQDTLLAIHGYRHTYDPRRAFGAWMYAIARHRLIDHVARRRRWGAREVLGEAELEAASARASSDASTDDSGLVRRALAALSQAQREVIQMLKLDGYTVAEIAAQTGRSEASIKVTAHRGYKALRKLIAAPGRDD